MSGITSPRRRGTAPRSLPRASGNGTLSGSLAAPAGAVADAESSARATPTRSASGLAADKDMPESRARMMEVRLDQQERQISELTARMRCLEHMVQSVCSRFEGGAAEPLFAASSQPALLARNPSSSSSAAVASVGGSVTPTAASAAGGSTTPTAISVAGSSVAPSAASTTGNQGWTPTGILPAAPSVVDRDLGSCLGNAAGGSAAAPAATRDLGSCFGNAAGGSSAAPAATRDLGSSFGNAAGGSAAAPVANRDLGSWFGNASGGSAAAPASGAGSVSAPALAGQERGLPSHSAASAAVASGTRSWTPMGALPGAPVAIGTSAQQPPSRSGSSVVAVSRSSLEAPLLLERMTSPLVVHGFSPAGGQVTPTPSVTPQLTPTSSLTPPRSRPSTPVASFVPAPAAAVRRWTPPTAVHLIHQAPSIVDNTVMGPMGELGIVHVSHTTARRARSADQLCHRRHVSEVAGLTTVSQPQRCVVHRERPGTFGAQSRSRSGGNTVGPPVRRVQSQPASARGPALVTVLELPEKSVEASEAADSSPEPATAHELKGAGTEKHHRPPSHVGHGTTSAEMAAVWEAAMKATASMSGTSTPAQSWPSAVLRMDSSAAASSAAPQRQELATPRVQTQGISWDASMETPSTAGELLEPPPSCVLLPEGGSVSASSGPNSVLNSARDVLWQQSGHTGPSHQFGAIPSMPVSMVGEQVGLPTPVTTPVFTGSTQLDLAAIAKFAKEIAKAPAAPISLSFTPPALDESISSGAAEVCIAATAGSKVVATDAGIADTAGSDVALAKEMEKELGSSTRLEQISPLSGDLAAGVAIVDCNLGASATDLRSAADAAASGGSGIALVPTSSGGLDGTEASLPAVSQLDTASAFQRGAQHLERIAGSTALADDTSASSLPVAMAPADSTGSLEIEDASPSALQAAKAQALSAASLDDPQALSDAYQRLVKQHKIAQQALAKRQGSPRRPKSPGQTASSTAAVGQRPTSKPAAPKKPVYVLDDPSLLDVTPRRKASQAPRLNTSRRANSRGRPGQRAGPN